ncbi:MAG: carbohydrate kinase [Maritimibacter sp.]|uniref:carbohydrate kinase family protein n=1 Tax=Maritimibacter sp. TaxID=2003363 RepID=UPI001D2C4CD8|nr:carbohydrate kinase [Maritimibacter sp.]MBL6428687.1 carbohydrate kinase [Maritimibacter sp.]
MILCCGEALIDMLPRESTGGEPAFAPYPGGAVFNTAIALGRLGVETSFFSGLSRDLFGEMLETALGASHVDAGVAVRSDRPTTLAFVKLVDGQARYAFYDENTAGRMLTPADLPDVTEAEALFFGGISLVVDPCGAAYEALMLREAGKRVTMIDPNIRPGFITDERAYRARIERMLAVADIVKISDEDMDWLGTDADEILANGAALVCVTEGAKGVVGQWRGGSVRAEAQRVQVVDTVGAGDTFNAGLLAGLSQAGLLDKTALAQLDEAKVMPALELGNRAAAITVSRAGANPPWANEL